MKTPKKIGIYLDHAQANLLEFVHTAAEIKTVESNFNNQSKQAVLQKGESHLHNKEQHLLSKYYEKLGHEMLQYNHVLLFGPTSAKTELFNILADDNRFAKITIEIKNTDKLTNNQQLQFVNDNFNSTI